MNENVSPIKARAIGFGFLSLSIVAISGFCTQYVAERFAYHSALGMPLFGRIYNPFDWWSWGLHFGRQAPETFLKAIFIFAAGAVLSILIVKLGIGFVSRSSRKHEGTHGTAHFASLEEVKETGLLNQSAGVYCGGFDDKSNTRYLRHNGPEHVCAIAPPRSGKGVGLIVPTLLSWAESVFVIDIRGENYAMSAGWRKQHANNVVLKFDPAERGASCAWNPLGEIRFGTNYQISDTQNVALMVIDSDGKGLNDHWRKAAFELLGGLIMHALYKSESVGRTPNLKDCADMMTSTGDFAAPVPENEFDDGDTGALAHLFTEMRDVTFNADNPIEREAALYIRGKGQSMLDKAERELASIISTASNELALYTDPVIGENTSRNDFKVADLMDHEDSEGKPKPVSLYFIAAPENLQRLKPLIRLLLTRIVMGLTGQMEFDDGRGKTKHKNRLLLMLDEFPALGRLEVFEFALAYIGGYGIKAYIITQDVQQLYRAYTNHETIISSCHVRIAYAPNKLETAEWLSKMTGQTTVIKEQISTSGKRFGMVLGQVSRSYQEVQRPLMTSDEIMRLPSAKKDANGDILEPGEMLIFVAGHPVIRGRQILYFIDPTFSRRSKIAPPKKSEVVRRS